MKSEQALAVVREGWPEAELVGREIVLRRLPNQEVGRMTLRLQNGGHVRVVGVRWEHAEDERRVKALAGRLGWS